MLFADVKDSDWFAKSVALCANLNLVNGYPDGSFRPDGFITRAEYASGLAKLVKADLAIRAFANSELRSRAMQAVVQITVMKGLHITASTGSGVFINSLGHLVTNHHVVEAYYQLKAAYQPGDPLVWIECVWTDGPFAKLRGEIDLIDVDPENDLALGRVRFVDGQAREVPYLRLANTEEIPGEPVVAMGAPMGVAGWESHGCVAREEMVLQYHKAPQSMICVAAAINPGNSGGALVRASDGTLLGINSAKITGVTTPIDNMGLAIHWRAVKALLDRYSVAPQEV